MKTQYQDGAYPLKLLVLVPHRDTRLLLRKWSAALFNSGCAGAWSFPWVAPLAVLSRPMSGEELKQCAFSLRAASLEREESGKIGAAAVGGNCLISGVDFPNAGKNAILGPLLDFNIPENLFEANGFAPSMAEKIAYRFPKPLLGACLVREAESLYNAENYAALPPLPAFFFRAAALANMSYYPLAQAAQATQAAQADDDIERNGYSFGWRIGKLRWLPPVKRKRHT